jgi:hypothetical protein
MSGPMNLPASNMSLENPQNSTISSITLHEQSDAIYTLTPTLSIISEENTQEGSPWKQSVKAAYLKFEAKTSHGKDRIILQARRPNGNSTEKMGEKFRGRVMIWHSAPWRM